MKKQLAILLSGALLMSSLCGCGKNSGSEEKKYNRDTSYEESTLDEGADLRQELNVPARFQDTWKSNSDITTITVDATVHFPQSVSKVPVFEVKPRNMTKEDLFAFCDAAFEGKTYTPVVYDSSTNQYHNVSKKKLKVEPNMFLTFDGEQTYYNEYYKTNMPLYTAEADLGDFGNALHNQVRFIRAYPDSDQHYTKESARSHAAELVGHFAPGMECVSEKEYTVEFTVGKGNNIGDDSPGEGQEQLYEFIFNRPYYGIPTTYTMLECTETDGNPDGYAPSSYYESVRVAISESGLSEMEWKQPHEQMGVISENPKLLSFDEAMQTATQMLPLKWAYHEHTWEETTSKNMRVESITFGYTRVLMKDAPTRYMMVPVWDFFGYFEASGANKSEDYSLLTINAIDGSVIDREYGY